MHPNSGTTTHPSHTDKVDTRALVGQSFSRARPHLFVGRIMTAGIKTFIANQPLLQYRTRTEIYSFYAQSLALETNNSQTHGSMKTMWRSQ
jgi:hypothetical protein